MPARAVIVVAMALTGCAGKHAAAPAPAPTSSPAADSPAGPAAPHDLAEPRPTPARTGPLTADECGQMIDKVLAIGLAEQHARDPRAPQATPAQQAAIRARLLAQADGTCATMSRPSFACALAATDRAAMLACTAEPPR